jgi:Tol biopolymer transport system component
MTSGIEQGRTHRAKPPRALRAALLLFAVLLALPLLPGEAKAQFFGQNKVQYKKFKWKVLRTQHFDIHYYQGTEAAVNDAALMAERGYARLSRVLNHQIRARIPLVLYASHTDFEQTNITPGLIGIGTGGVTEFLKRRVFLPFTGSYAELDHVLTHELVHAFQVDVLFGEQQGLLGGGLSVPLWFMEGMAEYLSVGATDPNTAMWLRDASLEGYLIPISILNYVGDIRVYRFGQSIFQYIAENYGIAKVGELLKRTRRLGSAEKALMASTGLTVDVLSKKWTESVRKEYLPQIVNHNNPSTIANRITNSEEDQSNFNVAISVSPSGLQYVYISDRSMYNDVYLASALDGKVFKKLIEGERTGSFETLRFFNTAIAWSPDEKQIAIPAKIGGEDALYLVNVPSGKVTRKLRFGMDAIYSPNWSPDGKRLAFVGLKQGHSSLYVSDTKGKNLTTLRSGRFAVLDPVWSPDGTRLAFATDEGEGTDERKLIFGPLKIAVLDVETGRVTIPPGQNGKNITPQWTADGRSLLFVSDRTGISNMYRMDLATGESVRLTNLITGISGLVPESPALSLSRSGNRLLFTSFARGGWDVYSVREPEKFIQSPPVVETAPTIAATPLAPLGSRVEAALGRSETSAEYDRPGSELSPPSTALPDSGVTAAPGYAAQADTGGVDTTRTDAMAFADSTLSDYVVSVYSEPLVDSTSFQHLPYKASFSRDYFAGGAVVASNVGFAGSSVISFSDLLGNHNILAVLNLYGNLSDSDVYLAYTNLSRRTNYGFAIFQYQKDLLLFTSPQNDDLESQIHRGGALFFSRPFNRFRRIEYGINAAVVDQRIFRYDYVNGVITKLGEDGDYFYVAPNLGLVHDNTLYGSTGPINGARSRLSVEHALGGLDYTTAVFDFRRYHHFARRLTFARRFLGGASFGDDPQFFRFGGAFTYRGADYGDLIGTRSGIVNLEMRFPLIEQLRVGFPLALSLGGVNGVVFLDAATAWNAGTDPKFFSTEGGFHTENFRAAFGFGARINLGYFILRYDYGREHRFKNGLDEPRHFITFGPEF